MMHAKTMEGLAGAKTNMDLLNTPFRVYKDARRRGDLATMERAMGYVKDFSGKAEEYKGKAQEGMEEDAKAAREEARLSREEAIQKRQEERQEFEKRTEESRSQKADTVEISEDGKAELDGNINLEQADSSEDVSLEITVDAPRMEPIIYTKTGIGQSHAGTGAGTSISVSV